MRRAEAGIQVDKFYPPTDWLDNNNKQIDIRKNAENNSIVLLVGHSADFSKYSLLGLLADTSSGTYDVYIDDVLVGSGITKNTQYDIDFSTINTTYGSATTPEALVLHKVVIKPTTSGATITAFGCMRTVGVTSTQSQGVLWCHFELENTINISGLIRKGTFSTSIVNQICYCVSSKGNVLKQSSVSYASFGGSEKLSYLPQNNCYGASIYFRNYANKTIDFIIGSIMQLRDYSFYENFKLELLKNTNLGRYADVSNTFASVRSLKFLPNIDFSSIKNMTNFLTEASNLYPTKLDVSSATGLTIIRTYGSSTYPMRGLRGLKVSNEAPFSGSSPQINVSYTGLDRDALVELFQSLPTVTGGQTLNCVACSGNNLTKVGSPTIDENGVVSDFSASNYLRITSNIPQLKNDFEIQIKFNLSDNTKNNPLLGFVAGEYAEYVRVGTSGKIEVSLRASSSVYYSFYGKFVFSANTDYWVRYSKKGNTFYLKYSTDGVNWILDNSATFEDIINFSVINYFRFGVDGFNNPSTYFSGSIDFNNSYVKELQNYLMKGYITDTDKAIATDKGWGLVLS